MPTLERLDNRRRSRVEIDRQDQELLGVGISEGTVNRVGLTVFDQDGRSKNIKMAEKIFDRMDAEEVSSNIYDTLENHRRLKELKIPTVPTMRFDPDRRDSIVMTDLSRGGRNDVISIVDWSEYGRGGKFSKNQETFSLNDPNGVSRQLADILEQVCLANIDLYKPDVFFLVRDKEDGRAKVILGDISKIYFRPGEFVAGDKLSASEEKSLVDKQLISHRVSRKTLLESNFNQIRIFIEELNRHLDQNSQLDIQPVQERFQLLEKELIDYFGEEVYNLSIRPNEDSF